MKKIVLIIIALVFAVQNGFAADTSYIKSGQNREDNYLANAAGSNGKVIKWGKNVINVYIVPCSPDKKKAILSAINLYNSAFWGMLKFVVIQKPEKADITIGFSQKIDYKASVAGESAGVTSYRYDPSTNLLISAKIELLDAGWSTAQIKQITLHEMGHAIGIAGHSLNQNDVMFPTTEGRGTLSKRDIETIKMIYKGKTNEVKNTLKNVEERKSEMNLEVLLRDTKYAPNKYIVWVNLGDYYYQKKNYTKALEAYKTALTKENAPSAINKRISYCYMGLGNSRMAERYMKLAK